MTTPRFTDEERARIRAHLGYLNVAPVSAIGLGFPAASQSLFTVEVAMDQLLPGAVSRAQMILAVLDKIECLLVESLERLAAQQVGDVKLRGSNDESTEGDLLEGEYLRWAKRLADLLGVELNRASLRFGAGSGLSGNVRVLPT